MLTIQDILSPENQEEAFEHLRTRPNAAGEDKIPLKDIREYWDLNQERFTDDIRLGIYFPGLVREFELLKSNGKKRYIVNYNSIDRFVGRLLAQKLNSEFAPLFLPCSYAYQTGKSTRDAVEKAREYISQGCLYVVEIDLKEYFDHISHTKLLTLLREYISDPNVIHLISSFITCDVIRDDAITTKTEGILQGCPISPVLSNLYLHQLDCFMENAGFRWIRFSDDINIYVSSESEGSVVYKQVSDFITNQCALPINHEKSGIFHVYERRFLGYDFISKGNSIIVKRHEFHPNSYFRSWHPSALTMVNREYHITRNGILNKKDFSLLFENADAKHHIPVESTEQISIYSEVTITPTAIRLLEKENIRLVFCDPYGNATGYFIPENLQSSTQLLLRQCEIYNTQRERLDLARKLEIASLHNIRANLYYYSKRKSPTLEPFIQYISQEITNINQSKSIDEMCLIEARCRQKYYEAFNQIVSNPEYSFVRRSKRPPLDKINAMISFGNTLLYNKIQQIIWRLQLDSRIGIVHAANRRHYTLNLDFADLFKPLIVDRIIFSLINRKQLSADDFVTKPDGSVLLSPSGKRLFITEFNQKLQSKLTVNDKKLSYHQLIEQELYRYKKYLADGDNYKPYKYR